MIIRYWEDMGKVFGTALGELGVLWITSKDSIVQAVLAQL